MPVEYFGIKCGLKSWALGPNNGKRLVCFEADDVVSADKITTRTTVTTLARSPSSELLLFQGIDSTLKHARS
jgi:hypothetical protein